MATISVTVSDAHRQDLDEVAKDLARAGMTVEQKLHRLGVITGQADDQNLESLKLVPGVMTVMSSRKVYGS